MFIYIFSVCVLSLPSRAPELPFWLTQIISYNSQPIFHQHSTDSPPTIETVLTECWLVYWRKPILGQHIGQYVSWHLVKCWPTCQPRCQLPNTSADVSTDSQPIWQLRVSWYGSWHVNQVVANRVNQYSTMGCSNYTGPGIFYCPL